MARNQRSGKGGGEPLIVYGVHPVVEYLTLAPERVERVWVTDLGAAPMAKIKALVEDHGIEVKRVDAKRLGDLTQGGNHQQVVLEGSPFNYVDIEEIVQDCGDEACVLLLDQVQDVGNLGAILRSAAAFGVAGVVIPKDRAAAVTGAVVRASAGQALRVKVAQEGNLVRSIEALKAQRFWVYATQSEGAGGKERELWDMDWSGRVGLVMGGEHQGVRRLVGERCDGLVRISMATGVESLNVSSAASVALYEIWRGRAKK
jgi:23S rRNA (guanosine2251-2'-O)-methyltransferase